MGHAHSRRQDESFAPWHEQGVSDNTPSTEAAPPHPEMQLQRRPPPLRSFQGAYSIPATDRLSLLALSDPEILDIILESLISRGALDSLASLSSSSRLLYHATLPFLWRTFIWDPNTESQEDTDAYWKLLRTSKGANYIRQVILLGSCIRRLLCLPLSEYGSRFFVDRANVPSSSDKKLPEIISELSVMKQGLLKAYVADLDDSETQFVDDDAERKVTCHLLPAYEPLSPGDEDLITLRHALVHLVATSPSCKNQPELKKKASSSPTSIGYAFFVIHPCHPSVQHRPLPSSINSYSARHPVPVLPVTLDAVLLAPSEDTFTQNDKPRLARIVFEFLAWMDQVPRNNGVVPWNDFLGQFSTQRIIEEEDCRSYINFHRQKGVKTVLICAQATVEALNLFRGNATYNWVELQFENDTPFTRNNISINRILWTLLPVYLEHAPRRLSPPAHGLGDIIIQDISDILLAGIKRVVPAAGQPREDARDVVEYYIKRYPEGTSDQHGEESWANSHDKFVVYYDEFPV